MNYRPSTNHHDGLWWQIALGIFVGQIMTAALLGVIMFLMGGFAAYSAGQALKSAVRDMPRVTEPMTTPRPNRRGPSPLKDGERCVAGARLRNTGGAWIQTSKEPC